MASETEYTSSEEESSSDEEIGTFITASKPDVLRQVSKGNLTTRFIEKAKSGNLPSITMSEPGKTGSLKRGGRLTVMAPKKAVGSVNGRNIQPELAEEIWSATLDQYRALGVYADTDAAGREAFQWAIAELFIPGTSRESDWDRMSVHGPNGYIPAMPLVTICNERITAHNPLRPFFRSFRQGIFPQMMSALLKNPENGVLRGGQILQYSCNAVDVHFAFDLADSLIEYSYVVNSEITIINNLKLFQLQNARVDARASGLVRPVQDSSQASRQTFVGSTAGTASTTLPSSGASRMTFPNASSLM